MRTLTALLNQSAEQHGGHLCPRQVPGVRMGMLAAELLGIELRFSLAALVSREGVRIACDECGEDIINERQVYCDGRILCRACAGEAYYGAWSEWELAAAYEQAGCAA